MGGERGKKAAQRGKEAHMAVTAVVVILSVW